MRHFKYIALASLLMLPPAIYADDHTETNDFTSESEELQQLLDLLQEQTTLATRTRLNADYVPGMIAVLHGDELENRGIRTVWEALALVPGVELSIEEAGRKQVVIRGIGRTYASGNTKILLNGTSMNSAHLGHATPVMNIPVEQVERIEVIRGPGSAIHGEFALIGVVNVITRNEEDRVYLMGGENSTWGQGVILGYDGEQSPLHINLNLAGWKTDGPEVITGEDELYIENGGANSAYSNAPGPTNEAAENSTAIFSLNYDQFSLTAQWLKDGYGDHFGRNQFLPPDEKRIVTRNKYRTVEIKQVLELSDRWDSELRLGWQDNKQTKDDLFAGPSTITSPSIDGYVDIYYREQRTNAAIDFYWTDKHMHNALLGLEYVDINVDHELNEYQEQGVTFYDWYFVDPDKRRRILSATLQDEVRVNDNLTFTLGARYDDYNDIDSKLSPRIAAVWRKDQQNIFKAQYARAFRPPTFYELSAAAYNYFPATYDQVDGSTIDTAEIGYIHKNNNAEYRITVFNSKIDKFIIFIDQTGFSNTQKAKMQGIELEFMRRVNKVLTIDANASYLDTDDENTGKSIPGSMDWIGNIGINFQPDPQTNIALQHHVVDKIYRQATDTRNKLNGYRTTDFTVSIMDILGRDVSFHFGLKNLFNNTVKYPAPEQTYIDDHPRAGSQWWMQLSYKF